MDQDKLTVVAAKIEKLLRLTTSPNEHEAALAASRVQELLVTYNLDMLTVGQLAKQQDNTREDNKLKGGLYKWQRDLWRATARLNFCMHWSIRGLTKGSSYEHRVLGSKANVLGTRLLSEYLEQTIERITRDNYSNDPKIYFSKAGIAYREGMAARIVERLREKRYEEQERAKEQRKQQRANADSERALTILDVEDAERDANDDFLYGAGYSAKRRAERAEMQQRWERERLEAAALAKKVQEEDDAFKRDFPEEWAAREARRQKEEERKRKREERNSKRRTGYRSYKGWEPRHESYYDGYVKGKDVSLNRQVDKTERKKLT